MFFLFYSHIQQDIDHCKWKTFIIYLCAAIVLMALGIIGAFVIDVRYGTPNLFITIPAIVYTGLMLFLARKRYNELCQIHEGNGVSGGAIVSVTRFKMSGTDWD